MMIDWPEVRQLMLTSNEAFPPSLWGKDVSRLDAAIAPDQLDVAERCLKALYQGLQWASKYEIKLKKPRFSKAARHFLIEDEHVIGIFRDCFGCRGDRPSDFVLPSSLREYIELQTEGKQFIVADLILEKENLRLVNRWGRGKQSKFMRDLVFPGFMGILAHYSGPLGPLERLEAQDVYLEGAGQPAAAGELLARSFAVEEFGGMLTRQLLHNVVYNAEESDLFLASHPPLRLFYDANSPFNLELAWVNAMLKASFDRDSGLFPALATGGFSPNGYPDY
ncbi:hypothetical protein [Nodosilinea nodulosa]|uniref:hypothetical protein n=1 Tax=Nodosilinea nodulosa TaxID=416001 RepID=UPI0002E7BB8A|nr:hypothetical protein [Nodosilinea nodulosa]